MSFVDIFMSFLYNLKIQDGKEEVRRRIRAHVGRYEEFIPAVKQGNCNPSDTWEGAVAQRLERRTLNRENPGSNPLLLPLRSFGNFVHSTLPQFTQLYK